MTDQIDTLAAALAIVQGQMKPVREDSNNPFFHSKYADLPAVWDSVRHLLAENGLAVVQKPGFADGRVTVQTIILHKSGQVLDCGFVSMFPSADKDGVIIDNAQTVASRITYGRRYGLMAALGITTNEDDDGNAASGKQLAQNQATPNANASYLCPTHNVNWFKSGKMKAYAHPVEGSKEWCAMPVMPNPPPPTQNVPTATSEALFWPSLCNWNELLILASKNAIPSSEVFTILGVTSVNEWKQSIDEAWVKIASVKKMTPESIKR